MKSLHHHWRGPASVANPGRRASNIDVLRALAALMVVAAHANYLDAATRVPSGALRHYMWSGVNLFFVLSGYLITRPFIAALYEGRPLPRIAGYAVRRASRILPAYWVVIAISLLIMRPFTATWDGVVSHGLLIQNSVPGQTYTVVAVAWTLGIEAAFYVLVPLAALALLRRRCGTVTARRIAVIVLGVWIASAVWSWLATKYGTSWVGGTPDQALSDAGDSAPAILTVNLPAKLFLFCPGILIALADCTGFLRSFRLPGTARGRGLMALAAGLSWWAGAFIDWGHSTALSRAVRDELFAVAFSLLLVIAIRARPWRSPIARVGASIGVVSYGLYLWHGITEDWLRDLRLFPPALGGATVTWLLATVAVALAGLVPAAMSWRFLERPMIARAAGLGRSEGSRTRKPETAAVSSELGWEVVAADLR